MDNRISSRLSLETGGSISVSNRGPQRNGNYPDSEELYRADSAAIGLDVYIDERDTVNDDAPVILELAAFHVPNELNDAVSHSNMTIGLSWKQADQIRQYLEFLLKCHHGK